MINILVGIMQRPKTTSGLFQFCHIDSEFIGRGVDGISGLNSCQSTDIQLLGQHWEDLKRT